jgi:hypothetical protein
MDHETRLGEGPDSGEAGLSAPASLMDPDWCGLAWTPRAAREREVIRQIAPALSGVYPVRRPSGGPARLTYIRQTGRGVRSLVNPDG